VIIPTYNRGDILMDSIQSVLDQTYDDFELIVVDDASSDDTRAVVEGVDDDRVKYLGHDKNKGAPVARNTGVSEAKGEFIAFQDSDDEWLSTKLEKQVDLFRETSSDVGVVYTGMLRVVYGEERYIPYSSVEQKTGDVRHSLARQNFVPTQVAAVRSACFDEVGMFDEDAWPLSDWELWIRISQGFRFDLVDEPLVTGKVRADSISTDHEAKVEARRHIVDKHTDFFDEATLSRQLFYIGHGYMKLGETRKGQTYLRRAVRTKPRPLPVAALVLSTLGAGAYTRVLQRYKQSPLGGATGAAEEDTPD
jgi:glycosyltransferase involved in cell wall biosynthesis